MSHAALLQRVQVLAGQRRFEEARQSLALALRGKADPELCNAMAVVLMQMGRFDQAIYYAEQSAAALPNNPAALTTLANLLASTGKMDRAKPIFERVIALQPDYGPARLGMANCLWTSQSYTEAMQHLSAARKLAAQRGQTDAAADAMYVSCLHACGMAQDAADFLDELVRGERAGTSLLSALAQTLNYLPGVSRARQIEVAARYGRALEREQPRRPHSFTNPRDPDRPLRVGFMSPDFRRQSVAFFVRPLWRGLDRSRVKVVAYYTNNHVDAMTKELRALADEWRDVPTTTAWELAERARADRIDVMVDLAGHTLGNRLEALHQRCAPVQATYLGYTNFTGVLACNARLVDELTDPPGDPVTDACGCERLVRMPAPFLCFEPGSDAPAPAAERRPGPIRFVSFNAMSKVHGGVMDVWARVLLETPGSRLVIKATQLADAGVLARFRQMAMARGIADRVELTRDVPTYAEHLGRYADVDIGLDPFPYHGTTTTCEAMAMGVPVVALVGDTHAGRVGLSLLSAVGMVELVAATADRYVEAAVRLARDADRLAAIRRELPARMRASPLCDAAAMGAKFEAALRGLWREWCRNPE